ncbi:hypothetical protein Tco_1131808 [Tanacetum coccineum]|uniref:Uncharacterized protein n=1 Tax=Tanacetum coccineum TaxID=301880 RepID=A0ABQ5JA38_9ASTR
MFIKYSTGQIPLKKSKGKGSQGKNTACTIEETVDVSEESDPEPARKRTASRRVVKKKVTITVDDNIIPEPDVSLELGKSMSLTEAAKEEAARQVHATHARIMTEPVPEPARRRPSGIAFRDTSSVSKKMFPDPSQKLKGVQSLTPEEQLAADIMKALKESKKTSRRQPSTGGSREGTGSIPGVPDESTVITATSSKGTGVTPGVLDESTVVPATSSEGTGTKPGVFDEENVTSEDKVILEWGSEQESEYTKEEDDDETIKWVDTGEEEEKKDDDDDKSIDLKQSNDEETNDEFMHGKEHA